MDDQEPISVEFVFPVESESASPVATGENLPRCGCGNELYTLVSEMIADTVKGIPASRMFECNNCGEYRLG